MRLATGAVLASAVVLAATTANAGEIRLADAEMDSVTAGETVLLPPSSVVQIGEGIQGGPVDFGTFEPIRLDGQRNPLEPAPPPAPPPFGGFDLGTLLGNLLGGLFGR